MTTYFEMQSNFDIYNEDNSISHNRLENIGTLEKPKTFLKSIDGSNVQKLFTNDLTNKDNDNYLSSQNYDSETIQRGFDEFNDDDFSYLKQEIDSYIKADDDESGYNLVFKNKNNHDLIPNNKSNFAEETVSDKVIDELEEDNFLNKNYEIWQKKRKSSKEILSLKINNFSNQNKIFFPKKHKLKLHQKENLKDNSTETRELKNVSISKNSTFSNDLRSEDKDQVICKSNQNSKSCLELPKNNLSNSSFSTAYNSLCTTPISSPESEIKKTLNGNIENMGFLNKNTSNKNLFDCYFEDVNSIGFSNLNINDTFKICHINSFCSKSDSNNKNNTTQNPYLNENIFNSAGNKADFNSRVNSVNNNSCLNPKLENISPTSQGPVYHSNPTIYYDPTNIANNSLINKNNFVPPIYNNFYQLPIYQNQINFNNCNISTSAPSYIIKKTKYANDPLKALRDQTNSMVRTSNGKAVPFEEPHNRINLENILRGKDKRTTLMIRHIPNKYTLQTILEDINIEFKDKYDLFYLPLDFNNNCNLGFAFINFVDSYHILSFYDHLRGKRWRRFNSEKICELAYAKFQGKKELINHFEKGSVMNFDSEDKKPLILPTPNPVPKISVPIKFFDAFLMIYPYSNFEIFEEDKKFVINSFYEF